jgi:hypothetical protein
MHLRMYSVSFSLVDEERIKWSWSQVAKESCDQKLDSSFNPTKWRHEHSPKLFTIVDEFCFCMLT